MDEPPRRAHPHARATALLAVGLAVAVLTGLGMRADAGGGTGAPVRLGLVDDQRPSPQPATSATPLGRPRLAPPDWGTFAFLDTQPDGAAPVAWDPCRPLAYVVNSRAAPPDGAALLTEAVEAISAVTGLQLVDEGTADEHPTLQRRGYQPQRYGDRWAPVLVAWSDETEVAELAGDVAGLAATLAVEADAEGRRAYVSGLVVLDGPQLGEAVDAGRRARARAVIIHELAHLLGLDHVDDPQELMHPVAGVPDLRYGDQRGLIALGLGACFSSL